MPISNRLLAAIAIIAAGFVRVLAACDVRPGDKNPGVTPQFDPPLSVSALETRLLRDGRDGRWDQHTLFAASLIASGVSSESELRGTCDLFAVVAAELKRENQSATTAEERSATALAFLHRRLLTSSYDLNATALPDVLATGRYNCVSATVLFNCLATEAGLDAGALRLPNHTCTEVVDGNRRIRVEATCADWFAARDLRHGLFGEVADDQLAADENDSRANISDVALVAMIYYNRGVAALARKDHEQAISLNRRALLLDSENAQARGNLLSALNKQALALAARQQFAAAIAIVDEGLSIDPNHAALRHNRQLIEDARHKALGGAVTGRLGGTP